MKQSHYNLGYAIIQLPELVKYINLYIKIWVSRKNQSNSDHRSNTNQPRSNMNTVDDIEHTYNNLKLEENRAMWGVISKVMERLETQTLQASAKDETKHEYT